MKDNEIQVECPVCNALNILVHDYYSNIQVHDAQCVGCHFKFRPVTQRQIVYIGICQDAKAEKVVKKKKG